MPKLTQEQEQAVRQWADEGANLNEIQDRLKNEHELTLTYFDARMLLVDLGLKLQEKKRDKPAEEKVEAAPESFLPSDAEDAFSDEASEPEVIPPPEAGGGSVKISLDQIAIPGTMASGKATFSDGKTASWYVDQMGRLGLNAPEPGYKPPAEDIPVFQKELDLALRRAGL